MAASQRVRVYNCREVEVGNGNWTLTIGDLIAFVDQAKAEGIPDETVFFANGCAIEKLTVRRHV